MQSSPDPSSSSNSSRSPASPDENATETLQVDADTAHLMRNELEKEIAGISESLADVEVANSHLFAKLEVLKLKCQLERAVQKKLQKEISEADAEFAAESKRTEALRAHLSRLKQATSELQRFSNEQAKSPLPVPHQPVALNVTADSSTEIKLPLPNRVVAEPRNQASRPLFEHFYIFGLPSGDTANHATPSHASTVAKDITACATVQALQSVGPIENALWTADPVLQFEWPAKDRSTASARNAVSADCLLPFAFPNGFVIASSAQNIQGLVTNRDSSQIFVVCLNSQSGAASTPSYAVCLTRREFAWVKDERGVFHHTVAPVCWSIVTSHSAAVIPLIIQLLLHLNDVLTLDEQNNSSTSMYSPHATASRAGERGVALVVFAHEAALVPNALFEGSRFSWEKDLQVPSFTTDLTFRLNITAAAPHLSAKWIGYEGAVHPVGAEELDRRYLSDRVGISQSLSSIAWRKASPLTLVTLLEALIREQYVFVVERNLTVLSAAVLCLSSMIQPLQWSGPVLPVIPSGLCELLDSPVPIIAGLPNLPSVEDRNHVNAQEFADAVNAVLAQTNPDLNSFPSPFPSTVLWFPSSDVVWLPIGFQPCLPGRLSLATLLSRPLSRLTRQMISRSVSLTSLPTTPLRADSQSPEPVAVGRSLFDVAHAALPASELPFTAQNWAPNVNLLVRQILQLEVGATFWPRDLRSLVGFSSCLGPPAAEPDLSAVEAGLQIAALIRDHVTSLITHAHVQAASDSRAGGTLPSLFPRMVSLPVTPPPHSQHERQFSSPTAASVDGLSGGAGNSIFERGGDFAAFLRILRSSQMLHAHVQLCESIEKDIKDSL